jgi:SH3-like domain-containing protein
MTSRVRGAVLAALFASVMLAVPASVAARPDDTGATAAAALLSGGPATTGSLPPKNAPLPVTTGRSGLPVPRFVSLKAGKVNVRVGPGEGYAIAWTFTRSALPVEVIQEYDTWRRVRDSDGSVGWVLQNLLSSKRTAVIAPWAAGEPKPLHASPAAKAAVSAYLEAGVLADVASCHQSWCRVTGTGFSGWIEQDQLWGVYPGEEIP